MITSIWFHTHYVFYITTINILKNRPFCNVSYTYGVSSVYTMIIHFMTYPAVFCLIKLTSSESSTITNEKCLSYICVANMNGVCNGTFFFGPAPWGSGEGPKGQISLNIIKFQLLSQFQRFLNQTLCVFSQIKDIKHIRRDFHLAAWVMPQGWDLGVPWGGGGVGSKKIFFSKNQPDSTV